MHLKLVNDPPNIIVDKQLMLKSVRLANNYPSCNTYMGDQLEVALVMDQVKATALYALWPSGCKTKVG